jgi:phosphopentomutase
VASIKRVIILVFDSMGVGALPDAAAYSDEGADTLGHIAETVGGLDMPVLASMGLGNIISVKGVPAAPKPKGVFGKTAEISYGKDTTIGLWEMAGVITENPFPTFPKGFPASFITKLEAAIGRKVMGNVVASGTEIIDKLGPEHVATGCPIVYTSADSVFQIAAHEEVIPVDELYRMCLTARDFLTGELGVDRVIARPFKGGDGRYKRTANRKDFGLPPEKSMLFDYAARQGIPVHAIGKTKDVYSGRGITGSVKTKDNKEGFRETIKAIDSDSEGIIMTILGDFDTLWAHRNDVENYAKGLVEADTMLSLVVASLRSDDMLLIIADHGCDPTHAGTDHTREYTPVLAYGNRVKAGVDIGTRSSMGDVGATIAEALGIECSIAGISFAKDILL